MASTKIGQSSTDDLRIRPAVKTDVPRIREVIANSFDGVTGHQLLEQRFGTIGGRSWQEWKASEIDATLRDRPESVLVAELNGLVVGVVSFRVDHQRQIGYIGNNGVDPPYQGRGIGTRMYERVLEIFLETGLRFAEVSTGADDAASRARRVYEKLGFRRISSSVRYLREL